MKKNIGVLAFQGDVVEHQAIIEKLGHSYKAVRHKKDLDAVDALILPGGESTTIGFFLEETGLGEEIKLRMKNEELRIADKDFLNSKFQIPNSRLAMPIWGTCAGAIVMAKRVKSEIVPPHLGLIDMTIERNAYGRQVDSFYASIDIPKLGIKKLEAAFIRAPVIVSVENLPVIASPGGRSNGFDKLTMTSLFPLKSRPPLRKAGGIYTELAECTRNDNPEVEVLARHEGKIVLVRQGCLLASTFHPELTGDTRLHEYFISLAQP